MSDAVPAASRSDRPGPVDDVIVLRDATWADYQRLLEIRGEGPVPRLTYVEGVLELMTPSQPHESIKSMIGRLVEAWCLEKGVDITPYGSWTLESKEADRGIEPDECYVLGDNPRPERADLAIEVEWTRGAIDKLDVYRKLGVREVWIWRKHQIDVFTLRGEDYEPVDGPRLLAGLDLAQLLRFVDVRPMTRAVTAYRAALPVLPSLRETSARVVEWLATSEPPARRQASERRVEWCAQHDSNMLASSRRRDAACPGVMVGKAKSRSDVVRPA